MDCWKYKVVAPPVFCVSDRTVRITLSRTCFRSGDGGVYVGAFVIRVSSALVGAGACLPYRKRNERQKMLRLETLFATLPSVHEDSPHVIYGGVARQRERRERCLGLLHAFTCGGFLLIKCGAASKMSREISLSWRRTSSWPDNHADLFYAGCVGQWADSMVLVV